MCEDLLFNEIENMHVYTALAIFTIYLIILMRNRKKLPPGPWSLPIVGYLPWLDPKQPYKTLQNLAKKYGPVYGIYMGNIYTVVLSDTKIIRKVFSKDETTGRAPLYLTHGLMKGYGIICSEGELWKNQRKFVYGCLRQFGGTKVGSHTTMENLINKHVLEFTDYVSSLGNSATIIASEHLRHYLGSFMTTIVFGECWSKDDEAWKYLQHLQEEGIKHIGIAGPLNFIPMLRFLPMFKNTVKFLTEGLENTHKIYDGIIENHQEMLREKLAANSDYTPQNFLDAYLLEREKKHNSTEAKFYSDQQLKYLLADVFGAGLDTTLTTLNWYILYIAIHTDFQKKIRDELELVLEGKTATMKDFQHLPFFEASVAEVQRIRSTVPIGIPHGTLCDIDINGFTIPSNTMVVPLLWAVHMDEKVWKDPDNFNPYRFLDENGRFFKPESFIPFQIGKRMCVGDELAKMLLYFFCYIILQKYELSVDNIEDIDLKGKCGITLTSIDHKITFRKY